VASSEAGFSGAERRNPALWSMLWENSSNTESFGTSWSNGTKRFAHFTRPAKWQYAGFHQGHNENWAKKQFQVCQTYTDPSETFLDVFASHGKTEKGNPNAMSNYGPREETLTPNWKSGLRKSRRPIASRETKMSVGKTFRVEMNGPFFKTSDTSRG
jgi:hypothetical protein